MKLTTVRARLALWNVGVLALALTGFGVAIHYFVRVNLDAQINRDLKDSIQPITAGVFHLEPPHGTPVEFGREAGSPGAAGPLPGSPDHYHFVPPPGHQGKFGPPPGSPGDFVPPPEPHDDFGHHDRDHEPIAGGRPPGMQFMPPGPPDGHRRDFFQRLFNPRRRALAPRLFNLHAQPIAPFSHDKPWDLRLLKSSSQGKTVLATVTVDGAPMRVLSAPIHDPSGVVGTVQVARSLSDMNQLMGGLARTLLMLIPLALLVAGLGGAFLTGRALRPVRRISQEAAQLGAADLSRRLPITGNDEFSDLAANFNRMIGRLDDAFRDLETAFERQRQFTADASHELRTPLTAIKANTSLALWGERTPAEYRQALESADRAADTMNRIVSDLLLLARSDTGQLGLDLKPIPIIEVLERAVADTARRPESASIDLDLSDPDLMVPGDGHSLSRLFVNLLENALRHTPPDGKVTLAVDSNEGRVIVKVIDTGVGIAPEHLPHLGERFYRVDSSRTRAHGGAGLGLSICRSIAAAHGGEILIDSALSEGTTVTVSLPNAAAKSLNQYQAGASPLEIGVGG